MIFPRMDEQVLIRAAYITLRDPRALPTGS
jgi:hypothetical protein